MRRPNRYVLSALIPLAAALASPLAKAGPKPGEWQVLAPVPLPTEGMSVGVVGNEIIAAFGFTGGDGNLTRIYDIDANSWSMATPGPLPPRSEGTAVTHGGHLYALGGRFAGVIADNDRYTPATDTWTKLTPMPTPRAGLGAAAVGNAIYAIGGRSGTGPCSGSPVAANERYDIDTGTWTARAPLPRPRADAAVAEHGGKIYVFGGCRGGNQQSNEVDIYDPVKDTWTIGANMPTARSALYYADSVGKYIYVMGGINQAGGSAPQNEAYDTAKNSWIVQTPMLDPRGEMGVVSHGGRVYTVGGAHPAFGNSANSNHAFLP